MNKIEKIIKSKGFKIGWLLDQFASKGVNMTYTRLKYLRDNKGKLTLQEALTFKDVFELDNIEKLEE